MVVGQKDLRAGKFRNSAAKAHELTKTIEMG